MSISTKKLTIMAALTAAALIIFIIEAQIPLPIPVPSVKLGLANTITLFALFYGRTGRTFTRSLQGRGYEGGIIEKPSPGKGSGADSKPSHGKSSGAVGLTTANAFMILACRIILGAVFTGRIVAFAYSVSGGLLGFAAQAVMKRFVTDKQIWACGAVGAVFHNIGQILAAMLVTGTPAIAAYLPILIIAGVATGVTTGFVAQITLWRLYSP